jgi:hypothetical protein
MTYFEFQSEKSVGWPHNQIDRKLTTGFVRIKVAGKYYDE